jgi:hypothetical protein
MPSQQLSTLSTAKDQDFKLFRLRHEFPPCLTLGFIQKFTGGRARRSPRLGDSCALFLPWQPSAAVDKPVQKIQASEEKMRLFSRRCASAVIVAKKRSIRSRPRKHSGDRKYQPDRPSNLDTTPGRRHGTSFEVIW